MSQSFTAAANGNSARVLSPTQDVVGVFDGFTQVFRDARPMKVTVKEEAKLMEHPLENGAVVTDHMVIQPVEIELTMTLTPETFRETYKEIKSLYFGGTILAVQTGAETYDNQIIQALPHDEAPEVFDTITMTLKMKEITIVTAAFEAVYKAKRPAQSGTAERGEQQPQEQKGSWASKNIEW